MVNSKIHNLLRNYEKIKKFAKLDTKTINKNERKSVIPNSEIIDLIHNGKNLSCENLNSAIPNSLNLSCENLNSAIPNSLNLARENLNSAIPNSLNLARENLNSAMPTSCVW